MSEARLQTGVGDFETDGEQERLHWARVRAASRSGVRPNRSSRLGCAPLSSSSRIMGTKPLAPEGGEHK